MLEPWDILRPVPGVTDTRDLLEPGARQAAQDCMADTALIHFATPCNTFSKARGKPLPNGDPGPLPLRSVEHPGGLPDLSKPQRWQVDNANVLARWTAASAKQIHEDGWYFSIENPQNSILWALPEFRELAALPGVHFYNSHRQ